MKRYLLCAILLGNLAIGMDDPARDQKKSIDTAVKELEKIEQGLPGDQSEANPMGISGDKPLRILNMNRNQLDAFVDAGGDFSAEVLADIRTRYEQLEKLETAAIIQQANADLQSEKVAVRALSPKKVHFTEAASDSDGSGIKRSTLPAAADIPAPFNAEHFKNASDDSDFEERIQSQGDRKTTGSPHLVIEKEPSNIADAAPTAVKEGTDPLAPTPIRQTETLEGDAPSSESYKMKILDYAAVPSKSTAVNKAPDTSGDAALAERLTEEGKTPGGPDTPQLALEPIASADGKAYGSDFDSDNNEKAQPEWSTVNKILIAAGVVAALYSGTETALAYKSIPEKEWNQTSGFVSKVKLVLGKTWENVKKRPSQMGNLVKRVPAAGASLFAKMKAKAGAA
ncbi:MAG: hypothetical protein AMXMBFR12_03630 [Candidatus Babeliales bacterium]